MLIRGLRDRGHDVVVSCVAGSEVEDRLRARGVRTTGVRPRGDADLWSLFRFVRWLRRERPDALLLTEWRRMAAGALAGGLAGVPRVVVRFGRHQPLPASGLRRRLLLRHVDRWYVNTREARQALVDDVPELDRAVHVVPNGVAPPNAEFADLTSPNAEFVDETPPLRLDEVAPAPPGAVWVQAAGTIAPVKGFDLLVDAIAGLPERVHLVVAGDEAGAGPLLERIRRLGLQRRVHLVGHRDDLPRLFAGCDLFVLSSRSEGCPLILLEALAAGVPAVVATDVPGVRDILGMCDAPARGGTVPFERGPTGWMVAPADAGALGEAIRAALDLRVADPEAYCAVGARARARVLERFGIARMVDGVEEALFGR